METLFSTENGCTYVKGKKKKLLQDFVLTVVGENRG